jgi:hypothetical protein
MANNDTLDAATDEFATVPGEFSGLSTKRLILFNVD